MRPRTGSFRLICVDCRRKRPANVRRSLLGTPVVLVGDPGTSFRSSCATRLLLPRGPVIERTHILLNRLWGSDRDPYLGNASTGRISNRPRAQGASSEGARQWKGVRGNQLRINARTGALGMVPTNFSGVPHSRTP